MSTIDDDKLTALREAWINVPFHGVVHVGDGEWIQALVNAVSAVVDPDRTLREEPEVKRIGEMAGFRQRHAYYVEQVKLAENLADKATLIAEFSAKRDAVAAECLAATGVKL